MCGRSHIHKGFPAGFTENHFAFNNGENGVILAKANAGAGMPFCAALTHDDIAGDHMLATKFLHTKRLPMVSRPLREEPPAFLCAILSYS